MPFSLREPKVTVACLSGDGVLLRAVDSLVRAAGYHFLAFVSDESLREFAAGSSLHGVIVDRHLEPVNGLSGLPVFRLNSMDSDHTALVAWLGGLARSMAGELTENGLRRALDSLPHGVWMSAVDGTLLYVNEVICAMVGKTREQVLEWKWIDSVHPDDREKVLAVWQEKIAEGKPLSLDLRVRLAGGTWRWQQVFYCPVRDPDGGVRECFGSMTDIHDQKLAQAELYLKSDALEHSLNAFDIVSSDGRFIYANRAYLQMWGYETIEEVIGTSPEAHCEDPAMPAKIIGELKEKGECRIEFKGRRKDGRTIDVLMWARRAYDADGNEIYTGTSFDVTEHKKADAALKESKEEAERANELKSAFLANISHEIRTPLGVMLGFADLLKDPALGPDDRKSYIETLIRNGAQLLKLVDDILDLAKIEADRLTIEILPTSPERTAQEIVRLLSVKAREQGITLEYAAGPDTPAELSTDPTRLRQVLMNVVANALKFTRRGGVKVRSYGDTSPVGLKMACFEVSDTGIGIPESDHERVFDMFVQADGSITRRFGGTGLGLPLSRKLARALGGDLTLKESKPGGGSTFVASFIDIPELPAGSGPVPPQTGFTIESEDEALLAGVRVLSVDDSSDNQALIKFLLTRQGALVDTAGNGKEGMEKALSGSYDVVLMDIQMPVMDGFSATQRLRSLGYDKPIVALTAHASSENRQKCLDAGCDDFMSKPIDSSLLIARIRDWADSPIKRSEFAVAPTV